jgi:hypothetical protein
MSNFIENIVPPTNGHPEELEIRDDHKNEDLDKQIKTSLLLTTVQT